jgi:hypothetical protein
VRTFGAVRLTRRALGRAVAQPRKTAPKLLRRPSLLHFLESQPIQSPLEIAILSPTKLLPPTSQLSLT